MVRTGGGEMGGTGHEDDSILLARGADTKRRNGAAGPIELATEHELWPAIILLAPLVPGAK